ncbi:MAG: tetratricopeptide repeat protein [Deltaproteobacteria bacterium]|nr:tetratricopeptide repeat protein [Deltaproteobacteria bacterium]
MNFCSTTDYGKAVLLWFVAGAMLSCGATASGRTLPREPRGAAALVSPVNDNATDASGVDIRSDKADVDATEGSPAGVPASVKCQMDTPLPVDIPAGATVESLHSLGQQKIQNKESQDAFTILRKASLMAPKDPVIVADFAVAQLQCGWVQQGVETMESAAMMAPENADIAANLAQAYQMVGRFRAAQMTYQKAVDLAPNDGAIRNNLAVVLVALGDVDAAEKEIRLAIALDPGETAYLVDLGYILVRQKRLQDAEIVLERAVAKDSDSADAYNMLGFVYYHLQHRERAQENFRKALSINPQHRGAQENLDALNAEFHPDTE